MASGHVNRTQRPNTWPHRPKLQREDCPCQPGAVHTWHKTDIVFALRNVRFWGNSGHRQAAIRCLLLTRSGTLASPKSLSSIYGLSERITPP